MVQGTLPLKGQGVLTAKVNSADSSSEDCLDFVKFKVSYQKYFPKVESVCIK